MIEAIATDLRAIAERCSRASRDIGARTISSGLDMIAIELMRMASEVEKTLDLQNANRGPAETAESFSMSPPGSCR